MKKNSRVFEKSRETVATDSVEPENDEPTADTYCKNVECEDKELVPSIKKNVFKVPRVISPLTKKPEPNPSSLDEKPPVKRFKRFIFPDLSFKDTSLENSKHKNVPETSCNTQQQPRTN